MPAAGSAPDENCRHYPGPSLVAQFLPLIFAPRLGHHMFMASLIVSLVAALVSVVSLGISYLSFRRDRPRVIATVRREFHGSKESGAFLLHIRLINSGAQAAQVDSRRFETEGNKGEWGVPQKEFAGPTVPISLNGYASIDWWVDVRNVMGQLSEDNTRMRVTISLGSGKIVESSWIAPTVSRDREAQEELDRRLSLPIEPGKGPNVHW